MKKTILSGLFILLCYSFVLSQSAEIDTVIVNKFGIQYLLVEKVPVPSGITGIPENSVTYRLFTDLEPEYEFLGQGGTETIDFIIESTQPFYNETVLGTGLGASANPALYTAFPQLKYDSYVTGGIIGTAHVGVLQSVNSDGYISITPETTPDADVQLPVVFNILVDNTTTSLISEDGWIVPGAVPGPDPSTNLVFIGQFTTTGELSMLLNISAKKPDQPYKTATNIEYPQPLTPPTVFLTSPADGGNYKIGSTINMTAVASDHDGTVETIQFFVNGSEIITIDSEPYQTTWEATTAGIFEIAAHVTDNDGLVGADTVSITIAENQLPVIEITAPLTDTSIKTGQAIEFITVVEDTDGDVDSVVMLVDGSLEQYVSDIAFDPFEIHWDWTGTSAADYNIQFVVYDNNMGYTESSTVVVTVADNKIPSVSITSPTEGAEFDSGDIISIEVTAEDSDGAIDSVEFFINATKVGVDYVEPYALDWTAVQGASINLSAKAWDNDGSSNTASVNISVNGDGTPPVVDLTKPVDGSIVNAGDEVLIEASASDSDGNVDTVNFYINDTKVGYDVTSPFNFTWLSEEGSASIYAIAIDNDGISSLSDTATIEVNAYPELTLTSPENNSNYNTGNTLEIKAEASDKDGTVDSVEFFVNDSKIGVSKGEPYSIEWIAEEGNVKILAKATDNNGAVSVSDTIAISVSEDVPPVCNIIVPSGDTAVLVGDKIYFTATATDDMGIDSVEFLVDGILSGVDKELPYTFDWTGQSAGDAAIEAIAYNINGLTDTSEVITITVRNPVSPEVEIVSPITGSKFVEGDTILFQANASDEDGNVDSVVFHLNTHYKLATLTEEPYSVEWIAIPGTFDIKATAYDDTRLSQTAVITVIVDQNVAPSISITSPISDAEFEANEEIKIKVNTSDSDGEVDTVKFFVNDSEVGYVTESPFEMNWTAVKGNHTIYTTAIDDKGSSTNSDTISITVKEPAPVFPEIKILEPQEGDEISSDSTLTIKVEASDSDGEIVSVEVYLNSVRIDSLFTEPYETDWLTKEGSYTIKAIATDNEGNTTESSVELDIDFVGLDVTLTNNSFSCYPNPVDDMLYLKLDSPQWSDKIYYNLITIEGEVISCGDFVCKSENENQMKVNMSSYPEGIYFIILTNNNKVYSRKIIKQ
jgi:hypothetical protein